MVIDDHDPQGHKPMLPGRAGQSVRKTEQSG
jgi:hypothetical protein